MIALIIYLVGVGIVFAALFYFSMDEDIIVGEMINMFIISLLSWIALLLFIVNLSDCVPNSEIYNKVIYHSKKERRNRI